MRFTFLLPALVIGVALMAVSVADAAPNKTKGCYQLAPAGGYGNASSTVLFDAKITSPGNPDSIVLAGDCNGGAIGLVDDGLTLTVANSDGVVGGTAHWNYNVCGVRYGGTPALDVTNWFVPGANAVTLQLTNDCGDVMILYNPVYLVITK